MATMTTFVPSGMPEPDSTPEDALALLRERVGIDFAAPYRDPADRRHELAVLAVDLGRRLTYLLRHLRGAMELDQLTLTRLMEAVGSDADDTSGHLVERRGHSNTEVLHGRVSELDRALRLLTVAYKQAWWRTDGAPDRQGA